MDLDYVWRARLELNHVDKTIPGKWAEGYLGKPDYEPATVWGDWSLKLALMNVQFNEIAKEAEVSWSGLAGGWTSKGWETGSKENAIKQMVRENFVPITEVIYDYERIPRSAKPQPEKKVIGSDEEMMIAVKDIHDHQNRPSQPWQRLVVEVKEGKLLNGTPLEVDDRKLYAFEVGGGPLQLKYKSPEACETKTETVKVYNSCVWGQAPIPVRMGLTLPEQEIGSTEFEIVCAEGELEFEMKWDHSKGDRICTYNDINDIVSFKLVPTKDPCVYKIIGGESPINLRKEFCEGPIILKVDGPTCPQNRWEKRWFDLEHQTRITGGIADFRDRSLPPFRPQVWHLYVATRCESLRTDCYGKGKLRSCVYHTTGWREEFQGMGTELSTDYVRGMPLKDGYADDYAAVDGDGTFYILHIDEEPFHRLEQRCEKFIESGKVAAPDAATSSLKSDTTLVSKSPALTHSDEKNQLSLSKITPSLMQTCLDQLLPINVPTGWSESEPFEATVFTSRSFFKGREQVKIELLNYQKPLVAKMIINTMTTKKGVLTFSLAGRKAVKHTDAVHILVDDLILSLKGSEALVDEWLPLLRLDSAVSDEQVVPKVKE